MIVTAERCRLWTGKHGDMETIGGRMRACYGVGTVNISTDSCNSANLVVRDKLLGFDLKSGIDAITALGDIHITQSGAVRLCSKDKPTYAAIHIDQLDSCGI